MDDVLWVERQALLLERQASPRNGEQPEPREVGVSTQECCELRLCPSESEPCDPLEVMRTELAERAEKMTINNRPLKPISIS